ncbi:Protein YzbB [hydrothermal vent metagenome]|uniref:Protein YzbB n=1 Tax=hydrothermal vent metagenome TaxID=652676 RepID=A0A3B0UVE6_9ZZZZ
MGNFRLLLFVVCLFILTSGNGSPGYEKIVTGASQPENYLHLLKAKRVGLVVNQTSCIGDTHLVDFLKKENIDIRKIFAPEHGFRGDSSAGEEVESGVDVKTGIAIISIYGKNKKPSAESLADIDVMVFDVQDVGCRFFTYISTLHYVIEACAENNVPLIVLDRPNPNGDYVDGPVLKKEFRSFVGMDPIPVVHGCTIGELAQMINGEMWHNAEKRCNLTVIPVIGYNHTMRYSLPVKPSPNLPNDLSVRLYPSLCFFEATSVSIGRGTVFPFQVIGYPDKRFGSFSFTPESIPGVAAHPVQEGVVCYGEDLRLAGEPPGFTFSFFLKYYKKFKNEAEFLARERWFNLLAGDDKVLKLIREGKNDQEIKFSFEDELKAYKKIRKKYLLYTDFE